MHQESDCLARAASHLAEEIEASRKAVMAAYGKADASEYFSERMEFWKFAARRMGARIGAVRCLKSLRGRGEHHTFTYIHQAPHPPEIENECSSGPGIGRKRRCRGGSAVVAAAASRAIATP